MAAEAAIIAAMPGLARLEVEVVSMGTRAARSFDDEELRRIGGTPPPPPAGTMSMGSGGEADEVVVMVPIVSVGTVTAALVPAAALAPVLLSIESFIEPSSLLRAECGPGPGPGPSPLISTSLMLILRNPVCLCSVGVEVEP